MELKDLIRQERKRLGLSQRDLARKLGLSHSAVAQRENGASGVSFLRLVDLCSVFGLRIDSFLGPGSPYAGEIVRDGEEMALLAAFRELSPDARRTALRMIRGATLGASPADGDQPQRPRRRASAAVS